MQRAPADAAVQKEVSATAAQRLRVARDAIRHVKRDVVRHSGNQMDALIETDFNARMRYVVLRNNGFWNLDDLPRGVEHGQLATAKALHVNGGACYENAMAAYYYLRHKGGPGMRIRKVSVMLHDHAFVLIGDESEPDSEWVVADPWPTEAKAVLWVDHFMYTPHRHLLQVDNESTVDGSNVIPHLASLISLNRAGEYAMRWDLKKIGGNPYIIVDKLEKNGFRIDVNRPVARQVLAHLKTIRDDEPFEWNAGDAETWSEDRLWVWCLSKVNLAIVQEILDRGYRGERTFEDAPSRDLDPQGDITMYGQDFTSQTNPSYAVAPGQGG